MILSVSEFLTICSDTLSQSFPEIEIEGEVSGYKVSQGKWVFFDLKDDEGTLPCFMPVWQLRMEITDGMKVKVKGNPNITKWGKFSFTVKQVVPVGEGDIKKSFEMLVKKLTKEGLFDVNKKRPIPDNLVKIGVISSVAAAGYADFCKIINERWGGLEIQVCNTQVQGMAAPDQMIRALKYLNERAEVQIIAIMRGGGSVDDLAAFNDEMLAREIAASRIPVITGIGHEIDESLADLAADIRASTPSNVAEMLTPDREAEWIRLWGLVKNAKQQFVLRFGRVMEEVARLKERGREGIMNRISVTGNKIDQIKKTLEILNPEKVLSQGYVIMTGKTSVGSVVKITTFKQEMVAEIKTVEQRKTRKE